MKKLHKPIIAFTLLATLAISSTSAYFTSSSESDQNIFTSGNLKIEVQQDDVLSVQDWLPGDEKTMEFKMVNTGSIPEYAKGYLGGEWSNPDLDPSVFEVRQLERKVSDAWVVVENAGLSLGEEFYLSMDGTEITLFELSPGEDEEFRLTVGLDEQTGDEYQNEVFSASLHLAARQVVEGATWPASY
jgi:predicted ribosomally synthesized peptide with SipW-like signal peptide